MDSGCDVTLNATSVAVRHQGVPVFNGTRNIDTKLWELNAPATNAVSEALSDVEFSNAAIGAPSPANLVALAHAALFSPALTTMEAALRKGFLTNFPGLTMKSLRKHPPKSRATVKGHLDQMRQNVRSTQIRTTQPIIDTTNDHFPSDMAHIDNTATIFADMLDVPDVTGKIFTDQPGKFVTPSSSGHNYIFILYDYDSNAILAQPMPTRSAPSILKAYKILHAKLVAAGRRPRIQRIDNECSTMLQEYMTSENIAYQMVPPGMHRRNAAERAIRTFKNHFIAGLSSVDSNFPIHLWDKLLEQAILTLNLLRGSRVNPAISAWVDLFGQYDYNATPIQPPGINVLVHDKPGERDSWAPHASAGWYIGPAMKHYRCYQCFMHGTQAMRITDTVEWFADKLVIPEAQPNDLILAGITDIKNLLRSQQSLSTTPVEPSLLAALQSLNELLHREKYQPVVTMSDVGTVHINEPAAPVVTDTTTTGAPLRVPNESATVREFTTPPVLPTTPVIPLVTFGTLTNRRERRSIARKNKRRMERKAKATTAATIPEPIPIVPLGIPDSNNNNRPQRRINRIRFNSRTHQREFAGNATVQTIPFESYESAYLGHAVNPDTGRIANYRTLATSSQGKQWEQGNADEFGRLLNGNGTTMKTGTNTMKFIDPADMPNDAAFTYLSLICAYRPEKEQPFRVRGVIGGDRLQYAGDVSTKTASLDTVKLHFNHIISTEGGRHATTDVKDFYLNTPMDEKDWVYLRIPVTDVPQCIMDLYRPIVKNGFVYVVVMKGMYGLKQAGKLANDLLCKNLAPYGYAPVPLTPGLWKHESRPITFTLVVDDFGIGYTNRDDLDHLLAALQAHYKISTDMTGSTYIGLHIEWNYTNRSVDISMPGFIERALLRFKHDMPHKPQHSPHRAAQPIYGKQQQLTPEPDRSPLLNAADTKTVQEIVGTLLYYARAVDPTLLTALSTLSTQQAKGTKQTMLDIVQLLNYCATHPNAVIRYIKSDMILHVESDASYLCETNARSRVAGYYYLSNQSNNNVAFTDPEYVAMHNGPVHVLCQLMKEVVSSAAEAEIAGIFHNAKEICPMRITLEELGHVQPATPIQTDNSTACGIANDTVKQRRSKAIDMRFYWIRDRVRQGQFFIYWRKGCLNKADYFTKHHAASHHQTIRPNVLHERASNRFALLADFIDDSSLEPSPLPPSGSCEGVLISSSGFSPNTSLLSRSQTSARRSSALSHKFRGLHRLSP